MKTFDVAIIGSGPGGYRAAVLAALRGLDAAIVEAGTWGGCCLNRGCVPKKAWYAAACAVADGGRFARIGAGGGPFRGDLAQAWSHQREVVATVRASYLGYLSRLGVARYEGRASFLAPGRVAVDGAAAFDARHVVVATGAAPVAPAGLAPEPGRVLTTDMLFESPLPPGRRVAVVGSGVVATELAWILAALGCEVRWLARSEPLHGRGFSAPALKALGAALDAAGVRPQRVAGIAQALSGADGVEIRLSDGGREHVDWVLLGTGRRPHTEGLGLQRAGLAPDAHGRLATDAWGATAVEGVHAIGDVTNRRMTANLALADAAAVIADIVAPRSRPRHHERVPEVVYSALELARAGMNEEQAEDAGREPAIGFAAFASSPVALAEADAAGFVRLVADLDDGGLLGAEIAGRSAGDLIDLVAPHVGTQGALRRLAAVCHSHPGRGEEILNAVETLGAKWGLGASVFGPAPDA